jgi:hypothetical protein
VNSASSSGPRGEGHSSDGGHRSASATASSSRGGASGPAYARCPAGGGAASAAATAGVLDLPAPSATKEPPSRRNRRWECSCEGPLDLARRTPDRDATESAGVPVRPPSRTRAPARGRGEGERSPCDATCVGEEETGRLTSLHDS